MQADHEVDDINWQTASPAEYEYQRAVQGIPHDPPGHVERAWGHLRDSVVAEAAEAIIVAHNVRRFDRPSGFMTADMIVRDHLGLEDDEILEATPGDDRVASWHQLLTYAVCVAKSSTRYWGVEDPEVEAYCSQCREPVPVEEFTHSRYKCDLHY